MASHFQPLVGDPAPWFHQRSGSNPSYSFDMAAGRYVVLCFFGSAAEPDSAAALSIIKANRPLFDETKIVFFGVSTDPADERLGRARDDIPGIRYFWDFDRSVSRVYGLVPEGAAAIDGAVALRRVWYVLDPALRVIAVFPFTPDGSDRDAVVPFLKNLPPLSDYAGGGHAPVLVLPYVFEPEFCGRLVAYYDRHGGVETGYYSEIGGRTVEAKDSTIKRRRDRVIADPALLHQAQARIRRRVIPEIAKVHQVEVARLERPIITCYDSADGGHFQPHRDNTTHASAHRQFAVSINLNEDFAGGELSFPEYGPALFKARTGGAVVFSCALLHAVSRVRAGRRLAFLPFLYDAARAELKASRHKLYAEPAAPPAE